MGTRCGGRRVQPGGRLLALCAHLYHARLTVFHRQDIDMELPRRKLSPIPETSEEEGGGVRYENHVAVIYIAVDRPEPEVK